MTLEMPVSGLSWKEQVDLFGIKLPEGYELTEGLITFPRKRAFHKNILVDVEPTFTVPVYAKEGFRVIARHSRYAISVDARVLDLKREIELPHRVDTGGYPCVDIYDEVVGKSRTVVVHRLLALAWVSNPNPMVRYIVNHKDGNKLNCTIGNLEWTDFLGNNRHAVKQGLTYALTCRVRDFTTGEVSQFSSIREAATFMGYAESLRMNDFNRQRPGWLLKGRYELRLKGDNTPWFYSLGDKPVCPGRYTLQCNDGNVFYDVRSMVAHYEVVNCHGKSAVKAARIIEQAKPGLAINVVDNYNKPKITQPRRIQLRAKNELLNEVLVFNSLREASAYLRVDKKEIKRKMDNGKDFKGWTFFQIETTEIVSSLSNE